MKVNLLVLASSVAVALFLNAEASAQRRVVVWSEGTAPKDGLPERHQRGGRRGAGVPGRLAGHQGQPRRS